MLERRSILQRARGLVLTLLPLSAVLVASDVVADVGTPIEITLLGPGAARIRLALGTSFPCDSGDNRRIIDGKFGAGQVIRASTPDRCVCFQQTYEPFSDTEWTASSMVCRPQICTNIGRKKCVPALDPTIRLRIRSRRPK